MVEDLDKKWLKYMEIGRKLGCHQMADRSFQFKGYQFPICARCTGVLIGYILSIIFIMFIESKKWIYISICFCLIMFLDWFIQYLKIKESNNIRRLFTGILGGIGIVLFMALVIKNIIFIIK